MMHLFSKNLFAILMITMALLSACTKDDMPLPNLEPHNIRTAEDLAMYFELLAMSEEVPGFAVNVVLNDNIAFQQSFGYADLASKTPYTNQTINNTASISKTFTAAAVAKAISQGLFTLETNINDVLPFQVTNPKRPDASIQIKHLVTHTSGIIDDPARYVANNYFILNGEDLNSSAAQVLVDGLDIKQGERIPLDEYLKSILLEDGNLYSTTNYLDSAPGEQWAYSNIATSLISYIIEYKSGEPFDIYVQNNVLTPLQMHDSGFNTTPIDTDQLATLYFDQQRPLPRYSNHGYAEGTMHTTNQDMAKYLIDMMRGMRGETSTLFPSQYYDLLFENKLNPGITPTEFADNQALYWYKKDEKTMHGGNSLGVSSHLQFDNTGATGLTIMSNMDGTLYENSSHWENTKKMIIKAIQQFTNNQ